MKYELQAKYDSRKGFYKKAHVEEENGVITLISYSSQVARVRNGMFEINSSISKDLLYSQTTLRHIREFYKQFVSFDIISKKDLQSFETKF